jgi:hypothetical protein
MTAVSVGAKWRAQTRRDEGTRAQQVRAVGLAFLLSYGIVLATRVHVIVPFYLCWLWALLPWLAKSAKVARTTVTLAAAYGCTMLGVCFAQTRLPWPNGVLRHPPFGEHPVTVYAGFPWQGVEGCWPHPLAHDCIPFDMGVDALLVNLTVFALMFHLLLRRVPAVPVAGFVVLAAAFACILSLVGGWQLVTMFD